MFETLVALHQHKMVAFLILSFKLSLQIFLMETSSLKPDASERPKFYLAYSYVDCTIISNGVRLMPLPMQSSSLTCCMDSFDPRWLRLPTCRYFSLGKRVRGLHAAHILEF